MQKISNIVLHHSASWFGNVTMIDKWHKQNGWRCIGYHFVILNGYPNSKWKTPIIPLIGSIDMGRELDDNEWLDNIEVGSHVLGFNSASIGICLIHSGMEKDTPRDKFYSQQLTSAINLVEFLCDYFKIKYSNVFGHYEKDKKKPDCPGFNMDLFREALTGPEGKKEFAQYMILNNKVISNLP